MKNISLLITLITFLITINSCNNQNHQQTDTQYFNEWTNPSGPYLGETPPGMIPKLFAGFLADSLDHKHSTPMFSNDGTELYFSAYLNNIRPQRILVTKLVDSVWTKPKLAEFSSDFSEGGPQFSPDNSRLYFYSKRPRPDSTEPNAYSILWFVDRTNDGWSEPQLFEPFQDFPYGVYSPGFDQNGNAYASIESKDPRDFDIWISAKIGDSFTKPIRIDEPISEKLSYENSCIILDNGQTIIITSHLRHNPNNVNIFISQKNTDSTWSEPKRMGDMLNNFGAGFISMSPDGKYLFFESYRLGNEQMFWVDAKIIDYLKTEDLNLIDKLKRTLLESGKDATISEYNTLKEKHSAFYLFDKNLFNSIGNALLDENKNDAASLAIELNQHIFDESPSLNFKYRIAVQSDHINISEFYTIFDSLSKQPENNVENDINNLGYRLIGLNMHDAAFVTFEMNTKIFPESGNVFDSFAEINLILGDTTNAITNYKQSLLLNPNNENAKNVLKDLGVEI